MNNQHDKERAPIRTDERIDVPVAALTITVQPHTSGHLPAFWDGTPAHSSGFGLARWAAEGAS
jgi:hypothetical protein